MLSEINEELDRLLLDTLISASSETVDREAQGKIIDNAVKLYKLRLEQTNDLYERDEKVYHRKMEKTRNWIDIAKVAASVVGVVLPLGVYWALFKTGVKFEETGSITSKFFGNLLNRIKTQ